MKTIISKYCSGQYGENQNDFIGLIDSLSSEFEIIGEGRARIVFAHGNYVIKAPKSLEGLEDNWWEADKSKISDKFCRCKLLGNVLLIMERVDTDIDRSSLPSWAYGIDCQQVGINKFGKLKAYDFGLT